MRRACAAGLAALLAAAAPAVAAPQKIVLGDIAPAAASWVALIAAEEGFFAKAGLAADFVWAGSTPAVVQQLAGGSIDIATTSFETAIRAADNGAPVALFASGEIVLPYSIMAAREIRSSADMKGKTIVLAYAQNANTVFWHRWLGQNGVDWHAVDQIYDGNTPNRYRALASGGATAALLAQPFDLVAADAGFTRLVDIGAFAPDFGFTGYAARRQWLAGHETAARAFIVALRQATAWFYDTANRARAVTILAADAKIDPASAAKNYDYYAGTMHPFRRDADIPLASVAGVVAVIGGDLKDAKRDPASYVELKYLKD